MTITDFASSRNVATLLKALCVKPIRADLECVCLCVISHEELLKTSAGVRTFLQFHVPVEKCS